MSRRVTASLFPSLLRRALAAIASRGPARVSVIRSENSSPSFWMPTPCASIWRSASVVRIRSRSPTRASLRILACAADSSEARVSRARYSSPVPEAKKPSSRDVISSIFLYMTVTEMRSNRVVSIAKEIAAADTQNASLTRCMSPSSPPRTTAASADTWNA